jgi:ABC-type transport system involved in multi-copper enzyme maturation permease subunit
MFRARLRWREMLPIVTRELRVAAKRRLTYRLRWIVALIGGLGVFIATIGSGYSTEAGQFVFWCMSTVMVFICASAGLILTADSVSREKREGTLGLLFLTRLTAVDVILGKLTVGALSGAGVAYVGLPFLAFSLCLGGVTAQELWIMSGALVFLLAYSLTLGIFVSTLFRREGSVAVAFCLLMLGPMAVTPLAIMKTQAIPLWLAKLNPFFPALALADRYSIYFPSSETARVLAFQAIAIAIMLVLCFTILPWTVRWQASVPKQALKNWLAQFRPVRKWKHIRFEKDPIYALSRSQGHALMLFSLSAATYFIVRMAAPTAEAGEVTIVILMSFLPKFFVLWHSSGIMAAEKQAGFLETLLTTPITGSEVLRGKMAALKWHIGPSLLFAFVALWTISTKWWGDEGGTNVATTVAFAAMIALLIDVHSIGWVGLWLGVEARDRRRALIGAAIIGLLAPWVPALFTLPLIAWMFQGPTWLNDPVDAIPLAMISANVWSFGIACFAMARVHEKFRSTATQTWAARSRAASA